MSALNVKTKFSASTNINYLDNSQTSPKSTQFDTGITHSVSPPRGQPGGSTWGHSGRHDGSQVKDSSYGEPLTPPATASFFHYSSSCTKAGQSRDGTRTFWADLSWNSESGSYIWPSLSVKLEFDHFSSPPHAGMRLALVIFLGHKIHTFSGQNRTFAGQLQVWQVPWQQAVVVGLEYSIDQSPAPREDLLAVFVGLGACKWAHGGCNLAS